MKDLSHHIIDIFHNSVGGGATFVNISITEDLPNDLYLLQIEDNGRGIPADAIKKVEDPFYTTRTTRKVGLGVPLLKMNCEQTGGKFSIKSTPGKGTVVIAAFKHKHLDRPAIGDIADTITMLMLGNINTGFCYTHKVQSNSYIFDTREVREAIDGVPLTRHEIRSYLKEMIKENLEEINYTK